METGRGLGAMELQWVATYRRNSLRLALSLLVIIGKCHEARYLDNDMTPLSILLHFNDWHANTVYIGICNWIFPAVF